jgi:hypothetical protein
MDFLMQRSQILAALALTLFAGLWAVRVHAGPAKTVYTPIVSYREWELELRGGSQDWARVDHGEQASVLAVGYGIAPRWYTEFAAEYTRTPGRAARVEELEWENIIQLTEHGRYWLDAGLFAEYAYNRLEGEHELKVGPMLQKEVGRSQFNLNLLFGRRIDARMPGEESRRTEVSYAAQWRWHGRNRYFNPGIQAFGGLGHTEKLHSEAMRAGPALFGEASLGGGRKFAYNAALLAGVSANAPDLTVRFQLEYEFF